MFSTGIILVLICFMCIDIDNDEVTWSDYAGLAGIILIAGSIAIKAWGYMP